MDPERMMTVMRNRISEVMLRQVEPQLTQYLHPEQARLGGGSTLIALNGWNPIQAPVPDLVMFGLVFDTDSAKLGAERIGRRWDNEAAAMRRIEDLLDHRILPTSTFWNNRGRCGSFMLNHPIYCWPISLEVYAAALDVDYDVARLAPEARSAVSVAIQAYQGHWRTVAARLP